MSGEGGSSDVEQFEPLVGDTFAHEQGELTLQEVTRLRSSPGAPRGAPFSLVFSGPAGLEQRIHELDHPALGRLALFLVPIGPGTDGAPRYEAVFN